MSGPIICDITQTIDAALGTVENRVAFSGPLVESSVSASATFEVGPGRCCSPLHRMPYKGCHLR